MSNEGALARRIGPCLNAARSRRRTDSRQKYLCSMHAVSPNWPGDRRSRPNNGGGRAAGSGDPRMQKTIPSASAAVSLGAAGGAAQACEVGNDSAAATRRCSLSPRRIRLGTGGDGRRAGSIDGPRAASSQGAPDFSSKSTTSVVSRTASTDPECFTLRTGDRRIQARRDQSSKCSPHPTFWPPGHGNRRPAGVETFTRRRRDLQADSHVRGEMAALRSRSFSEHSFARQVTARVLCRACRACATSQATLG